MDVLKFSLLFFLLMGYNYTAIFVLGVNLIFTHLGQRIMAKFLSTMPAKYNKLANPFKLQLFKELNSLKPATGNKLKILEVGGGTGANFVYYTTKAEIDVVEPNPHCVPFFNETKKKYTNDKLTINDMIQGFGEDLKAAGIEDESYDAVVLTLVFCTVTDVEKCAKEFLRVLRPGGKLFYLEHVVAGEGSWLRPVQRVLTQTGFWGCCFDGCCLDRDIAGILKKQEGWTKQEQTKFDLPKAEGDPMFSVVGEFIKPHVFGVAEK